MSKREKFYHDLIQNDEDINKDFLSIINSEADLSEIQLIHEDKYINGIYSDFTYINKNLIEAIIEVKAADIGVTDYIRGIGQVLQYEYFYENKISHKGYNYSKDFKTILVIPSEVIKENSFNIGKFKYPKSTFILEINRESKVVRKIDRKELENLSNVKNDKLISISQYYVRDNRLFEIYILLRYLCSIKLKGIKYCNRKDADEELRKTKTINNNNWRNAWISASSLGFINSSNLPTASGTQIGMLEYEDFIYLIYNSYIKPYINTIFKYLKSDTVNSNKNLQEMIVDIKHIFNNRDVLFLTQSNGRYLSSWLNIIRDDFGALSFKSRSNLRMINYDPTALSKAGLIEKIRENSEAYKYIDRLNSIL